MWYYSTNGQQQGPVDDATLDRYIMQGSLNASSYVWRDGMADWAPLGQVRPIATGSPAADPYAATCTVCGKRVGADNLIELSGQRVCAECKPLAVQSLREGVSLAPLGTQTAWRDGKRVVTYNQKTLPPRCFKCNQPTSETPMKRKVYWHSPFYYILIFVSVIIYVIVAILVRKRATVDIYMCPQHRTRRFYFILGGWLGAIAGLVGAIWGIGSNNTVLIVGGFVLFLGALIGGIAGGSVSRTARIKDGKVWLAGAGKEFLASLPPWAG
jgi:hypothetical protein